MISTMPKGGQAPSSPNAMPGGLGAILQQPGGAPKGMPARGMQQMIDMARKMSDMQLADVLAGKSMDVPQYVAMTEAMGRKSLRNAVQGAQAQQQSRQPSVKDRLLAEEAQAQAAQQMAGLDQLAAPNMDSVGMASGGIVAFADGGVSKADVDAAYEEWQKSKGPWYLPTPMGSGAKQKEANYLDLLRQYQTVQGTSAQMKAPPVATPAALPPAPTDVKPDALGRYVAGSEGAPSSGPAGGGTAAKTGIAALAPDSFEELQKKKSSDYLTKLEGLSEKQREGIAQIRKEGGGEALMQLGSALLGSRNLAEAGAKAGQQLASTAAATRKEIRAVENLANEYDLNLAKAQEAAEKGDMALALQYKQLADQAKYQQGMLAVHSQRNAIIGQGGNLAKVSSALLNIDKQALNEAKEKFPMVTKSNQAAFDAFIKKRSRELKMANPLTKEYAELNASDLGGGSRFNTVQSLPKGASVLDLES